jgi:hypothetical protein
MSDSARRSLTDYRYHIDREANEFRVYDHGPTKNVAEIRGPWHAASLSIRSERNDSLDVPLAGAMAEIIVALRGAEQFDQEIEVVSRGPGLREGVYRAHIMVGRTTDGNIAISVVPYGGEEYAQDFVMARAVADDLANAMVADSRGRIAIATRGPLFNDLIQEHGHVR